MPAGANLKILWECILHPIYLSDSIFYFVLAFVLIFLLYISKHTFVIFPAHEIKKLNWIEFRETPTYVKFDLCKGRQNAILM